MRFANPHSYQLNKIILIGFMGAGKTTLGRRIQQEVGGYQLVDLDEWIEEWKGKSISQIFEEEGEVEFRKMEREALQRIPEQLGDKWVLSCGGGTPCHFDNMDLINSFGTSIYLQASPTELAQRLFPFRAARPLIAGLDKSELRAFIEKLLSQRETYYHQAHLTVSSETWKDLLNELKK